jgi:hypothetical protein
VPLLESPSAEG